MDPVNRLTMTYMSWQISFQFNGFITVDSALRMEVRYLFSSA